MCQSHLYAVAGSDEELLFDEVARLRVEEDRLVVEPLAGEPVSLVARVREIDLLKHRIVVERI